MPHPGSCLLEYVTPGNSVKTRINSQDSQEARTSTALGVPLTAASPGLNLGDCVFALTSHLVKGVKTGHSCSGRGSVLHGTCWTGRLICEPASAHLLQPVLLPAPGVQSCGMPSVIVRRLCPLSALSHRARLAARQIH